MRSSGLMLVLAMAACGITPRGVKLVDAPPGTSDVAALVRSTAREAQTEKRRLVVYVGATWCEPCKQIHDAALAHKLDAEFPDLTLLVFDLDRDGEALKQAGYGSQYIPLFALPDSDGRAGPRRSQGGIKGAAGLDFLVGNLRTLLAK